MGSFNIIMIPCPKCQHETPFQTKAGSCELDEFHITSANLAELQDIIDSDIDCVGCGSRLHVACKPLLEIWMDSGERMGSLN